MDENHLRKTLPCGQNLAAHVSASTPSGSLKLPLPTGMPIALHWRRVEGFTVPQPVADQWGYRFRALPTGMYLGHFSRAGRPFAPAASEPEQFFQCPFDRDGNDGWGTSIDFDGQSGLNVSLLFRFLYHGQLPPPPNDRHLILLHQYGDWKYTMAWRRSGEKWVLEVLDDREHGPFNSMDWCTLTFDLDAHTVGWKYAYTPHYDE